MPIIIVVAVALSVAGVAYLLRRTVFSSLTPSAGTCAVVVPVRVFAIFAIVFPMGVAVHQSLGHYMDSERASRYEAQLLASLWREPEVAPADPALSALQRAANCYLKYVVGTEWPLMAQGRTKEINDRRLWLLYEALPNDELGSHLRAFGLLDQIAVYRATRIHGAQARTPNVLLHFLGLAVLVLLCAVFIEGMKARAWIQAAAVGTACGLAGALFAILFALDNPYSHPVAISPDDLTQKMLLLERIAGEGVLTDCTDRASDGK